MVYFSFTFERWGIVYGSSKVSDPSSEWSTEDNVGPSDISGIIKSSKLKLFSSLKPTI